jgi:cell division protein ZapA (FtsZ GTPase activity inhibitor)
MKNDMLRIVAGCLALALSAGVPCLAQSVPETVSSRVDRDTPGISLPLGTESLLAEISREVADKIQQELKEDGGKHLTARLAVVNAVPLSDLKRETEFGRIMGEYLLTDLADRGLRLTELRLGKEINILPQTGEFILSRNLGELADKAPELDYVVVSTYSNTRKTLIVQGRMVRLKDGQVATAWRHSLPLNRELLALFHVREEPPRIAVKGLGRQGASE